MRALVCFHENLVLSPFKYILDAAAEKSRQHFQDKNSGGIRVFIFQVPVGTVTSEKTCLFGFQPSKTQTVTNSVQLQRLARTFKF